MATGDKLVSLDGLKAVYDKVNGDIGSLSSALNTKAETNGSYNTMTVGNAEQLMSDKGVTDKVPYSFRASGGDGADREFDKIVGGTVAWNQKANNKSGSETQASSFITLANINMTTEHVVFALCKASSTSGGSIRLIGYRNSQYVEAEGNIYSSSTPVTQVLTKIKEFNSTLGIVVRIAGTNGETITWDNLMFFDLTQMFGSTIADYIYSLEQATPGAGIAWFKKLFPKPYYEYNPGELISVSGLQSHDMTGFNTYNIDTGKAKVVGSNLYQITGTYAALSFNGDTIMPDTNGFFTPSANGEITVTGGNDTTTCIHLVLDGERNGEYEPYVKHSYSLDDSLTLRGIPKLDSNNELYYDGDTYESDGTVTRRYGVVDLGTLSWSAVEGPAGQFLYENASFDGANDPSGQNLICTKYLGGNAYDGNKDKCICLRIGSYKRIWIKDSDMAGKTGSEFKTAMSGVYLVYELATSTTDTADPYQSLQILDPYGTEEYVTDSIVPVGHETFYPENLRSKVEELPKDFSTLIAPVEKTFKATQAYSSGALFIVNNVLYKATTSIANGATITPDTNCTATTLAAIIAALA